ncbi:MAG TPA: signal peptidase II [Clostridiaceae bacterium]|nr:signal peptidase II [Clostridiaceae bacterium]
MFWILIIIFITAADQITKAVIVNNVEFGEMIPVIEGFFYITHHTNSGAAWGVFSGGRYVFISITILASVIMLYFLFKSGNKLLKVSLSLILGGAIGNLIDRIASGNVVDFLDFYFGSYNYPTFNVADSFIVIGTILLSVYILFFYRESSRKERDSIYKTSEENNGGIKEKEDSLDCEHLKEQE